MNGDTMIEMKGKIFNQLEVIELDEVKSKEKKRKYWFCKCLNCGKTNFSVEGTKIRSGHTKSCGCLKNQQYIDLSNQTFGYLKVIKLDKDNHKDGAVWLCKCLLCNKEELIPVRAAALKSGHTKSCGCINSIIPRTENVVDLLHQKFGALEVISYDKENSNKGRGAYWLCKCHNCNSNKLVSISGANLRNGKTSSCGCITSKGELQIRQFFENNKINYKAQQSFSNLISNKNYHLRYDFSIKDKNDNIIGLIEFNARQHYEIIEFFGGEQAFKERIENDQRKIEYANKNNIPLLILRYDEQDISSSLKSFILKCNKNECKCHTRDELNEF